MKLPMYITLTYPNENKFVTKNFIFENLDECLNKIIITVKDHIQKKIDYPTDLDEFTNIYWYENNSMNNEVFDYYIFINDEWKQPWTLQEIYDDVIEIIYKNDIQNAILDPKNQPDYESENEDDAILDSIHNVKQNPSSNNILEEYPDNNEINKLQKMFDNHQDRS